jgi:hypothetical protein
VGHNIYFLGYYAETFIQIKIISSATLFERMIKIRAQSIGQTAGPQAAQHATAT